MNFQFLYLGHLIPAKGIPLILKACFILKQATPNFFCHIVGAGTNELSLSDLENQIKHLGLEEWVMAHGAKYGKEKEALLTEADALLFPTSYHNECFPLVLLEAMRHALPVIATPVGAIPDMVLHGENGLIVPENDADALAGAMLELLSAPEKAKKLGENGRKRYETLYTAQAFETALVSILNDL